MKDEEGYKFTSTCTTTGLYRVKYKTDVTSTLSFNAQGGYMLKKAPEEYTVGMILRLTEGSLAPVECVEEEETLCPRKQTCATFTVWKKMNDAINSVVDNITLADLVEISEKQADNYII